MRQGLDQDLAANEAVQGLARLWEESTAQREVICQEAKALVSRAQALVTKRLVAAGYLDPGDPANDKQTGVVLPEYIEGHALVVAAKQWQRRCDYWASNFRFDEASKASKKIVDTWRSKMASRDPWAV